MLITCLKRTGSLIIPVTYILIALIFILPISAYPAPLKERLLLHLVTDGRDLNYRGNQMVMTCFRDGISKTIIRNIIHSRNGKTLILDMFPAEKKGSVILDDGRWMKRWESHSNSVIITHSSQYKLTPNQIQCHVRLIERNYRIRFLNDEMIANRICYSIELIPRHHPKRIIKVWLDKSTGMPLCHQVNDMLGNTLGLTLFSNIQYPRFIAPVTYEHRFPDRLYRLQLTRSSIFRTIPPIRKMVKFNITVPVRMPPGFEFEHCELLNLQGNATVCLRYTDGLSNITICESKDCACLPSNASVMQAGRYSDGDYIVTYHVGSMDYAVMGQNDLRDLQSVASSLNCEMEQFYASRLLAMHPKSTSAIVNLRDQGLGMDEIDAVMIISKRTGESSGALANLLHDGWGWEALAKHKGIDPRQLSLSISHLFYP